MEHVLENKYSSYMVHVCGGSQSSGCKSNSNSIHAAEWMSDLGEMSRAIRIKIYDKVIVKIITHTAMQVHAVHDHCCFTCSGAGSSRTTTSQKRTTLKLGRQCAMWTVSLDLSDL
jgi:hypothetical protein